MTGIVRPGEGQAADGIIAFAFDGHEIRVIVAPDGTPWWVVADACAALDIVNVGNTVSRIDPADIRTTDVRSGGQYRAMKIVNESGLWDLVLDSRKPNARKFRRWVTSDVLPQIRKTGSYTIPAAPALPVPDEEKAARVIAIFAAAGVGDPAFWAAKAQQLAGRMLGEAPEYDPKTRPLTVQPFLKSIGLSELEIRKASSTFGKKLKAAYRAVYSDEPPVLPDLINRHMVDVAQYREEHRALFEQVCAAMNLTPKDGAA